MASKKSYRAECVKAFLDAIQYQASFERDPIWSEHGVLHVARYVEPCDWHWPRDFRFREEFYVVDVDPTTVVEAIRGFGPLDGDAHLINAFCAADECITKLYAQSMYQHCFTKCLLGKDLGNDPIAIDDHNVIQFDSADDADFGEMEESERPVKWTLVGDQAVRHYCVCEDGKAVSWSMLVMCDPSINYVGQMFTLPEYRRKGRGSALLSHMQAETKGLGRNTMILMPSYETVDWYPKFGYRSVANCAIFCPQL